MGKTRFDPPAIPTSRLSHSILEVGSFDPANETERFF